MKKILVYKSGRAMAKILCAIWSIIFATIFIVFGILTEAYLNWQDALLFFGIAFVCLIIGLTVYLIVVKFPRTKIFVNEKGFIIMKKKENIEIPWVEIFSLRYTKLSWLLLMQIGAGNFEISYNHPSGKKELVILSLSYSEVKAIEKKFNVPIDIKM